MKPLMAWKCISVPVVRCGKWLILVDKHGHKLRSVRADQLAYEPIAGLVEKWSWELQAKRMAFALARQIHEARNLSSWQRKTDSLAKSFCLRSYDLTRPTGWCHFESYPTHTWPDACHRMREQCFNRVRLNQRTGWQRWAATVSNNHNKRKGGRYAKTCNRNG